MPADQFQDFNDSLTSPPSRVFAITPDDGTDLGLFTRGLMVSTAGDVRITTIGGDDAILPALQPGIQYAIRAKRIFDTDTTATGIVGLT